MYNIICVPFCIALLSVVSARPRYIVIPLDNAEAVGDRWGQIGSGVRIARQAWQGNVGDQAPEQDGRVERQAHGHHEHVDYGAHTGHHGAFGWYADFPVKTDH